uniref:Plectin/eS10 N-terminal domain-containing protein n=1 Tax=Podarcis muralis TaxID=64176 RepID=A0A670IZN4_PODMU
SYLGEHLVEDIYPSGRGKAEPLEWKMHFVVIVSRYFCSTWTKCLCACFPVTWLCENGPGDYGSGTRKQGFNRTSLCFPVFEPLAAATMLMPKNPRSAIYKLLFEEGVMVAKKDVHMSKHMCPTSKS